MASTDRESRRKESKFVADERVDNIHTHEENTLQISESTSIILDE